MYLGPVSINSLYEKRPQLHRFGRDRARSKALTHAHRVSTFWAANEAFYGQIWILRAHSAMSVFIGPPRPMFWGVQYHLLNLDPGLIVGTVPNSLASLRGLVRRKDVNPGTLRPGGVHIPG